MTHYQARLDNLSKILTFVLLTVMLIPLFVIARMAAGGAAELWIPVIVMPLIFFLAWLFHPTGYALGEGRLLLKRHSGAVSLAISDIQEARVIDPKETGFGVRLFGSGGMFGYFGLFRYNELGGNVHFFVTDKSKLILITTESKRYMVSPEDSVAFMKQLQQEKDKSRRNA